jgi:hypothetical protein
MLREEAERAAVGSQRGGGADDAAAAFSGWDGVQDIKASSLRPRIRPDRATRNRCRPKTLSS